MAGDNRGKKAKVDENGGAEDEGAALVQHVEKLQEIQDELEKINEEVSDKVLEVEQKYNEIRRPVYEKRNEIIKSIPDFWLTALLSHPALGELLTEEDKKIFKYLISLDVEDSKDVKSGFSITFYFAPNPYFEDEKLTKVFSFSDEGTTIISGTQIKWKEGMDFSNGDVAEKKGKKRSIDEESFFSWFAETQEKGLPEAINDEIADIIKEDLWPNPLKYFNNEADEDEFDGDDDDEEKGSEDDGDQDDEEEEDS